MFIGIVPYFSRTRPQLLLNKNIKGAEGVSLLKPVFILIPTFPLMSFSIQGSNLGHRIAFSHQGSLLLSSLRQFLSPSLFFTTLTVLRNGQIFLSAGQILFRLSFCLGCSQGYTKVTGLGGTRCKGELPFPHILSEGI